jgi:hypothetical protein
VNPLMISTVQQKVGAFHGLSVEALLSKEDKRICTARARYIAMYLSRRLNLGTTVEIGEAFNCGHPNVIAACKRVENDPELFMTANRCRLLVAKPRDDWKHRFRAEKRPQNPSDNLSPIPVQQGVRERER